MNFVLERVSDPLDEPITLAEMKRHLRQYVLTTADDSAITDAAIAAREWVEEYTKRALVDQTWRLTLTSPMANTSGDAVGGEWLGGYSQGRPGYYSGSGAASWLSRGEIFLYRSPVIDLVSFAYLDENSEEAEIDPTTYELREGGSKYPRIVPIGSGYPWTTGDLRVTFRAGFADRTGSPMDALSVVPRRFVWALRLYAEALYYRDEKMMERLMDAAKNVVRLDRVDIGIA